MTQNREKEPIAIIGMGCRFPGGVNNPEAFWNLMRDGIDAITEVPEDRWNVRAFYDLEPGKPGKTHMRWGGFLEDIDKFDAQFFRISPREAALMDPQQRLLLETAWEALEDAGQIPQSLAGSNTGVFIGLYIHDYQRIQLDTSARNLITAQTNTGAAMSIAANRISYVFDFHGPSIALDTACSSSLVTVHLACQSIWNGESTLALAGGANVILKPEMTIGMTKASMLSPDGHSKSFDATADGFARGEGAGIVVLKPLSRAVADRDPIYAVIRGSAVNQDGRTNGITVPNGQAQEAVLWAAYRQAGVLPEQVQYVEAHGTGTAVGDPIEANALGSVLVKGRPPGKYCFIGSIKSNIGHLESAAGVAGLIKAALVLKHRQIPPNLHFQTPNSKIPFEELQLRVPQTLESWPEDGNGKSSHIVGVNSFGFGGTNAHVVLEGIETEELPQFSDTQDILRESRALLLPLSAHSPEALQAVAKVTRDFLTAEEPGFAVHLSDICYTASLRRGHHDHRLALVANSKAELVEHLDAFLAGEPRLGMSSDRLIPGKLPQLTFVFSGMGSQWWAMGRQLLESEPIFQEKIQQCDALLREYASWSLWEELTADEEHSRINETQISQTAIFSVQIALAALWRSWGIEPDAIAGHSVGEVAAAHVAGVLSLEDAIRVIFHRSRVQAKAAGLGKMLAVGLSSQKAAAYLVGYEDQVSIAAINSPESVTIAGDTNALEDIAKSLEQQEIFHRFLRVDVPYHSPLMEALKAELLSSLQGINPQTATISLFSTVTGQRAEGAEFNAHYWGENMRNPVLFAAAVDRLIEAGYDLFLELSAHPVLAQSISECLAQAGKKGTVISSLRRKEPERVMLLGTLGKLYTLGYPVDLSRLYPEGGRFIRLPCYPWQRERYWQETEESQQDRLGHPSRQAMLGQQVHPLLGCQMKSAHPLWDGLIDKQQLTYLNDHRVQEAVVYPGAAYVEMALAAAGEAFGQGPCFMEEIEFQKPLLLTESDPPTLQLYFDPSETSFSIYSCVKDAEQSWVRHVTGKLTRNQNGSVPKPVVLSEIRSRCINGISKKDCYEQFHEMGLQYGPCFQAIAQLWSGKGEVLGQLRVPEALETEIEDYRLHPSILDACFQLLIGIVLKDEDRVKGVYLPVQIDQLWFYGRPGLQSWAHVCLVEQSATHLKADIQLLDERGNVLVKIQGLRCQSLRTAQELASEQIYDHLYEYQWQIEARLGQDLLYQPADYIPSPLQISESLESEATRLSEQLGRQDYYDKMEPRFNVLCTAYIFKVLRQLGWEPQLHQRISLDSLAEQLSVVSQHQRLLGRLLEILDAEGILNQIDGQWEVIQLPAVEEPQEIWKTLLAQFPDYQAELMLLGRCGQKLAEVLRGEVDPLQLIFPEGSLTTSEHLYQDSPSYRIYNHLVRKAITTALEHLPEGRKVRVLEIGAGTGSMTSYVLPKLPTNRTEYLFTDVSPMFTTSAEKKFRDYPFVKYEQMDIETDPVSQGFAAHSFDLILASDVLHATRDLHQTLENVKQLLASNGLLVLLELTNAPYWFDLVFGMLKGWWLFADVDVRPTRPLLPLRKWQDLLEEVGFTEVASLSDTDRASESLHTVILAQSSHVQQETLPEPSVTPQIEKQGTWLIFADSSGVGQQLAELLKERSETPILVSPGEVYQCLDTHHFQIRPEDPSDMQRLLEAVSTTQPACRSVVHLWSLDIVPSQEATLASLQSAQPLGCLSVLHLVQALANVDWNNSPHLWLVTSGTQAVEGSCNSISVAQSPLWGLGRVIINEHPTFRCKMADLSPTSSLKEIKSLFQEFWSGDQEDELALRDDVRYVHRFVRMRAADIQAKLQKNNPKAQSQSFRLEIPAPGSLENLTLRTTSRQKPGHGEVEIQVCAAGLNLEDVAKTKNLSADANLAGNLFGQGLGVECAGIITAVGEGVEEFETGDEVIAFAPHSFGSHATTDARLVVHKPQLLSFEEAATIPLAFLTAYYALHYLGRLSKGDRVLIHSSAASVGLAAIQLAQQVGAEIFATAYSPEEQEFLQAMGVKHVIDSRSLAFADEVMERTGGKGVDVVLNFLEEEGIPKNLSVLGAYGRFVEIGKQNIYQNTKLSLRPFQNNLSFFAVDVARLLAERPDFIGPQLCQVVQSFAEGTLHPLPHRVFPISKARSAFRYMAQAEYIGKVTISLQDSDEVVASSIEETVTFGSDGTYLITGGLGGFSLAVAQWLIEHGVRHLVLMGRSGASSPAAKSAVKSLQELGAEVLVVKADVTQEQQVKNVLADIRQSMPPLQGIIHAAMVLDDDLLLNLNEERMQKVMAPKIIGAWNLHTQTLSAPLDFFWLFSSLTSIVGNPGQGNYSAANAFLDALAHHRHTQGLPALSINWGAVAKVGYVAQKTDVSEHLERIGVELLLPQHALKALGELFRKQVAQAMVAPVYWQQWSKIYASGASPRFSPVVGEAALGQPQADDEEGNLLSKSILAAEPAERQQLLEAHICELVARVLLTSVSKLDIEQPLTNLGFDSLMAVELSNRIKNELGVELPTVKLIQGPSIVQVATQVNEQLAAADSSLSARVVKSSPGVPKAVQVAQSNGVPTEDAGQVLTGLDQLSDTEVDTLLNSMLPK